MNRGRDRMAESLEDLQVGIRFYAMNTEQYYEIVSMEADGRQWIGYQCIDHKKGLPGGTIYNTEPRDIINAQHIKLV